MRAVQPTRIGFNQPRQYLLPAADQYHPEGLVIIQAKTQHLFVARLKDMQVDRHSREKDRVEREKRKFVP